MSTLLLYRKPVPLSRETHRQLRIDAKVDSHAFAAATNSVPLACSEFAAAALEFPIVFALPGADGKAGDANGPALPVALLGLRQDENLFVSTRGAWEGGYIPAFIRRYPFLLAEKPGTSEFTVCIDEAYAGFSATEGESLFGADGADTPVLRQAIEFLNNFQGEFKRTQAFVERLKALDLLIPRVVRHASRDAPPFVLQGLAVVDEKRLSALDDRQLGELMRTGYLAWIHAHLLSLGNVNGLSRRFESRLQDGVRAA